MKIVAIRRAALLLCAAGALAGCGASQVEPGQADGRSWIAPQAKSQNLLYLSDVSTDEVDIYSYPQAVEVGKLTTLGQPRSECADSAGNVWIADVQAYQISEFPHGATKPIVAFSTFGAPRGCSVDPKTGNLAVSGGLNGTAVTVWHEGPHHIWRDGRHYLDPSIADAHFCGYDASGNLFVDGLSKKNGGTFVLAELPYRGTALVNVAVSQSIAAPGQVQWDGSDLAIGDTGISPSVIYQFSVSGSTATEVGSTTLTGTTSVRQFWISGGDVVGPDYDAQVGFWSYPGGGSATKTITSAHGYGAAVSLR